LTSVNLANLPVKPTWVTGLKEKVPPEKAVVGWIVILVAMESASHAVDKKAKREANTLVAVQHLHNAKVIREEAIIFREKNNENNT